jgi:hypothetical protein
MELRIYIKLSEHQDEIWITSGAIRGFHTLLGVVEVGTLVSKTPERDPLHYYTIMHTPRYRETFLACPLCSCSPPPTTL